MLLKVELTRRRQLKRRPEGNWNMSYPLACRNPMLQLELLRYTDAGIAALVSFDNLVLTASRPGGQWTLLPHDPISTVPVRQPGFLFRLYASLVKPNNESLKVKVLVWAGQPHFDSPGVWTSLVNAEYPRTMPDRWDTLRRAEPPNRSRGPSGIRRG